MTVEVEVKDDRWNTAVKFGDLEPGQAFRSIQSGVYYIKMFGGQAVRLTPGPHSLAFSSLKLVPEDMVIPTTAKITVEAVG